MNKESALLALVPLLAVLHAVPVVAQERTPRKDGRAQGLSTTRNERAPRVLLISEGQRRRWQGEKVSLSLKDADLVEVLRSFARLGDINLVIDPSVQGTVTVELQDVPWDQALSVILKTHRLGAEIDGRILTVAPPSRLLAAPAP